MIAGNLAPAATETPDSLRKTADEEHRVRVGADGARIEVWRCVATIDVPHPALSSLACASEAERAQLALPLDPSWAYEDTLPLVVVSEAAR